MKKELFNISKILLKNAEIITMDADKNVIKNSNVGIEDDLIRFIGGVPLDFKADKVIDCSKKVIMPGICNAHTHIPMSLLRNYGNDLPLFSWLREKIWPVESKLTSEQVYWGSLLSIAEMIKGGTTAFCDMYFLLEGIIKSVGETGIRGVISEGMMGESSNGDLRFDNARSLYKTYSGEFDGRISFMAAPHAPYTCSDSYINSIIELANELNIPIHIHLSESRGEVQESLEKYKKSPVKRMEDIGLFKLKTIAAHCVHLSDDDIDILYKNNVSVANNPSSNLKLGNGFAPVQKLLDKGINVALGTDGASSNNNQNMFEEMHLASLINKAVCEDTKVIPAITALEMATVNGVEAMNLDKRLGSIEVGKKADLIAVDFNKAHLYPNPDTVSSIVYSAQASDVSDVIVNGNILMENYELKTIDMEKVIYNVNKITKQLY